MDRGRTLGYVSLLCAALLGHSARAQSLPLEAWILGIAAMTVADAETNGIVGQITIRPVRPVERLGVPNHRPYQATVTVLDQAGQVVTRFKSDANGNFRVALPSGTYVIHPESPGLYPRASDQTVTVTPQSFRSVQIVYDSGKR